MNNIIASVYIPARMKKHLAIFSQEFVDRVFSGKKTIESRFSQKKIAPFGVISPGDTVYIKPSGKEIVGQFKVKKVVSFEGLDEEDMQTIQKLYGKKINAPAEYFTDRKSSNYATIIFIGNLEKFITPPIRIRKSDLRGWVVLDWDYLILNFLVV